VRKAVAAFAPQYYIYNQQFTTGSACPSTCTLYQTCVKCVHFQGWAWNT